MLCKNPFRKGVMEYGCSQCMPCRINKSRLWVGRMLLELNDHVESAFVTLTYSDDSCPVGAVLVKKDLQDFIKRLRWYTQDRSIRYFAVGEYGSLSWRPHFHLIIFGLSPTEEIVVQKAWTKGFVYLGTAEKQSMAYVCSYVLKGMKSAKDLRLKGRSPEFALMSKRPGLGHGIVSQIAKSYQSREGQKVLKDRGWFENRVRIGPTTYPLGRYLGDKVQEKLKLDKTAKKVNRKAKMFEVYARKSATTTTQYEKLRKAKVAAQGGRVRKQLQTI